MTSDPPAELSPLDTADFDSVKAWKDINTKAVGNICLHLSPSIHILTKEQDSTAKTLWQYLQKTYKVKCLSAIFDDFAAAMAVKIPYKGNPLAAITNIGMFFTCMEEADIGIPDHLEALILLSKLPSHYFIIVQAISQLGTEKLKELMLAKVRITVMNTFSSDTIGNSQPQNANKFFNILHKKNDPKLSQQHHNPSAAF
ncbi:hypothetical protein F5051DRAFT_441925 [Lentinula edodes]|nr:hypothetical protein F5051DRAFT_441925 [Lentinula edodes]